MINLEEKKQAYKHQNRQFLDQNPKNELKKIIKTENHSAQCNNLCLQWDGTMPRAEFPVG